MNWLFQWNTVLAVIGILVLLRQLVVIFSAEQGRKKDLIKNLYRSRTDFYISILVPYLASKDLGHLHLLLKALENQDYPTSRVNIHLACTRETVDDLDQENLPPNVKVWTFPEHQATFGQMTSWLIERCLAAGETGLFAFLKPTDIVKPDFLQNIVASGHDSAVIQGYVASKNPPRNFLEHLIYLSRRVTNRISNAGKFHMGLSCRLQDSGWVIKQEVLEMIPYRRGLDLDNLEYTLRLRLSNFRVNWAPSVVVYSDEHQTFIPYLSDCLGAAVNRFRLLARYSLPLLFRGVARLDFSYLEALMTVLKPTHFVAGFLLAVMALLSFQYPRQMLGTSALWANLAAAVLGLHLLSLVVSRCKPKDYLVSLLATPV